MAITNRAINSFFEEKKQQSETVAWTDETIKKLKQCYIKNLLEAGVIQMKPSKEKLSFLWLAYNLRKQLEDPLTTPYLNAITGERNMNNIRNPIGSN